MSFPTANIALHFSREMDLIEIFLLTCLPAGRAQN